VADVDQTVAGLAALCLIPLIHRDQSRDEAHRFYRSHGYADWCERSARFRKQLGPE
jgi:hypothetical protein